MDKFRQCIQSNGPSFMTKFCSALYLENLLTNIFAKLNLRGGVSCMPAALLFNIYGCGGHLGHVTWISQSNFRLPHRWMLHIKFHFFTRDDLDLN